MTCLECGEPLPPKVGKGAPRKRHPHCTRRWLTKRQRAQRAAVARGDLVLVRCLDCGCGVSWKSGAKPLRCKICRRLHHIMACRAYRKRQGAKVDLRAAIRPGRPRKPQDDPASVIAAKLRQAEAHVRATKPFELDPWAQRGSVEGVE